MGAAGMNAKRKEKRRRHAKARKVSREKVEANTASRPQQPQRRAPQGNR